MEAQEGFVRCGTIHLPLEITIRRQPPFKQQQKIGITSKGQDINDAKVKNSDYEHQEKSMRFRAGSRRHALSRWEPQCWAAVPIGLGTPMTRSTRLKKMTCY